ncbi:uncharacterized protein LOC116342216 isoform X3 [Contarinia nasturtii]|uniref:uncharacterized protein LOC116342216 isoform X3 n=1 Tax=Contarinia nasturtii TaxID=265458 RepID=UPI0012D47972|nr:uncharacterized protein LOC116342216 isoform X3 [Contarinia nasturtii]
MEPSGNSPDNNVNSLQEHPHQPSQPQQHHQPQQQNASTAQQQPHPQTSSLERLSRPMAFDKMEILVREMQDQECGVPVRSQKLFLTSIPSAFMGYDLIEWLMEHLSIEESEALNIANQLCLHGYFFPVSDSKTLVVKDDSSLYRFQTPYYWPWQHKTPDNVEYAIYLVKRSLRNKQRHGLEDYEVDALASLHKNLKAKWDFITMQAEEQVKLSKDRKKGDKIVADSQERAFWRVYRPPPGQFTPLESCPVPSRDRQGKPRRRTSEDVQREVVYLKSSLGRTRIKMSQACEFLSQYWDTFSDYDFFLQSALPSNPWVTEDQTFWALNNSIVDIPTEKRVKRWAISIEELVSDPTGLQEFTNYLRKEYSHENIRFWITVNDLRRSAHSQIARKVREIYEEFLEPGAPCEINIDSKTMEKVQIGLKTPSRFTFDAASEHIYALLLKKDCYPRFIRSEHYKTLLGRGIQPQHKKRFFNFGGPPKKKSSTTATPNLGLLSQTPSMSSNAPTTVQALSRRRGSDRSLTGSAHELAVCGVKDASNKVPHSHSQSNLSDIPYSVLIYRGDMPSGNGDAVSGGSSCNKEVPNVIASTATGVHNASKNYPEGTKLMPENSETNLAPGAASSSVCPWDDIGTGDNTAVSVSVCPWEEEEPPTTSKQAIASSSSDISEISERMRKTCGLRQNTLDCEMLPSGKRLAPISTEPRRASITITPRLCDMPLSFRQQSGPTTTTNIEHQPSFDKSKKVESTVETIPTVTKSSKTDLKSHSSSSLAATQCDTASIPSTSSPQLPTKTRSFDDRECLRAATASVSDTESEAANTKGIDSGSTKVTDDVCHDKRKSSENISLHCENMEQNNTNVGQHEQISAALSIASDTNLEASSLLSDDAKVRSESLTLSASPPKITVMCAPCIDDILAETAAQQAEKIECDVSDSEEIIAQTKQTDDEPLTTTITTTVVVVQCSTGVDSRKSSTSPDTSNLKLSLERKTSDEAPMIQQDDLSPSMDEYEECHPTRGDYQYDTLTGGEVLVPGCVAPAPTPAPLIAPLAEIEIDPPDDDIAVTGIEKTTTIDSVTNLDTESTAKLQQPQQSRTKKKKQKSTDKGDGVQPKPNEEKNRNAICPWEDEEDGPSTSDDKFVKTYSTLGYL